MKKPTPIKININDLNEAFNTHNVKIILAVLKEYAAFKKKGPLQLTEDIRLNEFLLTIKRLGLVPKLVPNERAKQVWK